MIFLSCDPPVTEEDNIFVEVLGLFPSGPHTVTALALKTVYLSGSYANTDSLLFIHMDSSGNISGREALLLDYRPYVEYIFPIDNNRIILSGEMYHYSYVNAFWELSLDGSILGETEMPQRATGIAPAADGNLFFFGKRYGGNDENDELVYMKIGTSGDTLWSKEFEISTTFNITFGLGTQDNGCLALGTIWSAKKSDDIFALRIDANGDTLWTGTFGGDSRDYVDFAMENPDGSFLITGRLNVYDTTNVNWSLNSGQQVYLIKLTVDGEKEWTRALGNTLREEANAVIGSDNGDYIVLGTRSESYVYLFDETTGWIARVGADGHEQWLREFESSLPMGVVELPSGNLLSVASNLNSSSYGYHSYGSDMRIIKLSSSGTVIKNSLIIP
jgi:hypothetical protein